MLGPIVEGERIRLEPPRADYLPVFVSWLADRQVTRYLLVRHPPSIKQEEEWLESTARDEHSVLWTIVLKDGGRPIGSTALMKIDWRHRHAESGIAIGARDEWGKGHGREAMALRTRYAFRDLGLEKVSSYVSVHNEASRRALEGAGYRQCGVFRRHFFTDGRWEDAWIGEVLRQDWEKENPR